MPPPVPPSVNDGRTIAGKPVVSSSATASSNVLAIPPLATPSPIRSIASPNCLRSSAIAIARADAPISSTPCLASTPRSESVMATLSAVWPPIGLLALDDQLDELRRHRLDVRPIRDLRIGHDRRWVGVDQDDLEPLLAKRLGGLRTGVVELGRLPDDDRAGADDEDPMDVSASRHESGRR